ncbi:hypothetical protein [Bartonella henselae]|uniref:hypothetical protein n=1 Tax=Bartonella henselae TaxID=38323 RepID=UPI00095C15A1|nr:hypothetical protein AT241_08050 [Bartonella henselae]
MLRGPRRSKQGVSSAASDVFKRQVGYVPWGDGAAEYFYNLYEYEDGTRECEKFDGGQYYKIPENADFSTKAQVKAWRYGGAIPKSVLSYEALIDEVNENIKQRSQAGGEIDRQLEEALDKQLGRYKNNKKIKNYRKQLNLKHDSSALFLDGEEIYSVTACRINQKI